MKITLPLRQFPENRNEQHELITGYFQGKEYQLIFAADTVDIILSWPLDPLYHVDPDLNTGLNWWSPDLPVSEMPFAIRQKSNYQLSLYDNWTLYAWSNWFKEQQPRVRSFEKLIILHIDDHRDCMSPLLFMERPNVYLDPLTGKLVSMENPLSIRSALESGAIAVGSFMPVFFHQIPAIEFRHLLPPHRMVDAHKSGGIRLNFDQDHLLCSDCDRPAMKFESQDVSRHSYHPTADLSTFLANIPPELPVLLHVDMDYFNNRFDGDSDWQSRAGRHDPGKSDVMSRVAEVFQAIITIVPKKQLENITVALSPGFFPAEFWSESISIIDRKLQTHDEY